MRVKTAGARVVDGIARAEESPNDGSVSIVRVDARGATNETSPRATSTMEDEEGRGD